MKVYVATSDTVDTMQCVLLNVYRIIKQMWDLRVSVHMFSFKGELFL